MGSSTACYGPGATSSRSTIEAPTSSGARRSASTPPGRQETGRPCSTCQRPGWSWGQSTVSTHIAPDGPRASGSGSSPTTRSNQPDGAPMPPSQGCPAAIPGTDCMGFVAMPEGAENIALEPVPAVPEPTREPAEPAEPSALERAWVCLADVPEVLLEEPPPQVWLLSRWQDQRDHGVLPRGRTGLLTATGGVGKTYALIQLALAVASGGFWLDTFRAAEPGHVLLALAEEDLDEVRRRIWRAANAAELSTSERRAIADRLHILPLAGVSAALTSSPAPGVITATAVAEELRRLLEARGVDWSLVILDPLSRWAGGGVEADNEAATRFCQVVETL